MLTIFSIPKPFTGHIKIIQRNAIQSWLRLEPSCEVVLCGDDPGVEDTAVEFNLRHIPNIERNEFGTPLLRSAFNLVRQSANNDLLCYVNSDIILLYSLIDAVRLVSFRDYLLLGQRWNMDILTPIDFDQPGWEEELQKALKEIGKLQAPFGSDYFVFHKEIEWHMPDFAVGRPGWDNWFIYKARALNLPVIDATESVTVIHQSHDYAHVPEGDKGKSFEGPEAVKNRELLGGEDHSFNVYDSTHCLKSLVIKKALDYKYLFYRVARQPVLSSSKNMSTKTFSRFLQALLNRRRFFPRWILQNAIYYLTK